MFIARMLIWHLNPSITPNMKANQDLYPLTHSDKGYIRAANVILIEHLKKYSLLSASSKFTVKGRYHVQLTLIIP